MISRTLRLLVAHGLHENENDFCGFANLEQLVNSLNDTYTTVQQRQIVYEGQTIELRNVQNNPAGILLHFVAYTCDDQMPIVTDTDQDATGQDIGLANPPEDAEFLDGDLMMYIRGNDVVMCKNLFKLKALTAYLSELSIQVGHESENSFVHFANRLDVDQLELMQIEGVHNISMNAVAHSLSIDNLERRTSSMKRLLGGPLDELKALFGIEDTHEGDENLKVEVALSYNKSSGTDFDQTLLNQLATRVIEEDEGGFSIVTLQGRKIRHDEVVISKVVKMEPYGKTVRHVDAWGSLVEFYNGLVVPSTQA